MKINLSPSQFKARENLMANHCKTVCLDDAGGIALSTSKNRKAMMLFSNHCLIIIIIKKNWLLFHSPARERFAL